MLDRVVAAIITHVQRCWSGTNGTNADQSKPTFWLCTLFSIVCPLCQQQQDLDCFKLQILQNWCADHQGWSSRLVIKADHQGWSSRL